MPDRRREEAALAGNRRVRMAEIGGVKRRHAPHLQHGVAVNHFLFDTVMGDAPGLQLPERSFAGVLSTGLAGREHGLGEIGPRAFVQLAPVRRKPRIRAKPGLELLDEAVLEVVGKFHRIGEHDLPVFFYQGHIAVRLRDTGVPVENDPVGAQDAPAASQFDIAFRCDEIAVAVEIEPVGLEEEGLVLPAGMR